MGSRKRDTDLILIKARAEFIRQRIMSSDKAEYGFNDLIIKDMFSLIHRVNDYASFGGESIDTNGLPVKLFGRNSYSKDDLVYRVDEILALISSLPGNQEKTG